MFKAGTHCAILGAFRISELIRASIVDNSKSVLDRRLIGLRRQSLVIDLSQISYERSRGKPKTFFILKNLAWLGPYLPMLSSGDLGKESISP